MKRKKLLALVCIVVFTAAFLWRFFPHKLSDILSFENDTLSDISVYVTEISAPDHSLDLSVYSLEASDSTDNHYDALANIIKSTKFRSDFRNILPWDTSSVNSAGNDPTLSATIKLVAKDSGEICIINFLGESVVTFDFGENTDFSVYHPTNRDVLRELAEYVKANGTVISHSSNK